MAATGHAAVAARRNPVSATRAAGMLHSLPNHATRMTTLPPARLMLILFVLLAEALHLGWEASHGGIVSHHLLQRSDLPGISNAWGLLILPALAAWAGRRLPRRRAAMREWAPVALGFALPLLLGAALSLAFQFQMQGVTEALFFGLLLMAVLLPAHRPESLLGFVLGMSWTFGAVLPLLIGSVIAGLSWIVRRLVRRAWHAVKPA
jgi:hypothetical protein